MTVPAAAVLAVDDLALLATAGFFVPAALVAGFVAAAVYRDRRRGDDESER
jgi:hypothetical protein